MYQCKPPKKPWSLSISMVSGGGSLCSSPSPWPKPTWDLLKSRKIISLRIEICCVRVCLFPCSYRATFKVKGIQAWKEKDYANAHRAAWQSRHMLECHSVAGTPNTHLTCASCWFAQSSHAVPLRYDALQSLQILRNLKHQYYYSHWPMRHTAWGTCGVLRSSQNIFPAPVTLYCLTHL